MEERTCSKCGEVKPLDQFKVDRATASGHKQPCKRCSNRLSKRWAKTTERGRLSLKKYRRRRAKSCNMRYRSDVLEAYGNCCACCGESTPEFLTVDHVNNDGAQHRKSVPGGTRFYHWLVKAGFPKGEFQLLCWNCNCAKGKYGECPHERDRREKGAKAA